MLLDHALITELLHDLAHRLALTGQPAAIRLVGGAAVAVGYFNRRVTLDIDTIYHPGDIDGLLRACEVTSVEQAQSIYGTYHAQGVLSPGAQARVHALLERDD